MKAIAFSVNPQGDEIQISISLPRSVVAEVSAAWIYAEIRGLIGRLTGGEA